MSDEPRGGGQVATGCAIAAGVALLLLALLGAGGAVLYLRLRRSMQEVEAELAEKEAIGRAALEEERRREQEERERELEDEAWEREQDELERRQDEAIEQLEASRAITDLAEVLRRGFALRLAQGPVDPAALAGVPCTVALAGVVAEPDEERVEVSLELRVTGGGKGPLVLHQTPRSGPALPPWAEAPLVDELPSPAARPLDLAAEQVDVAGPGGPRCAVLRATDGDETLEVWASPGLLVPVRVALREAERELVVELTEVLVAPDGGAGR